MANLDGKMENPNEKVDFVVNLKSSKDFSKFTNTLTERGIGYGSVKGQVVVSDVDENFMEELTKSFEFDYFKL